MTVTMSEQEHDEADLKDPLFHLEAEVAPRESLEGDDRHVPAVEKRDREQVEDAEVEAQKRHEREELPPRRGPPSLPTASAIPIGPDICANRSAAGDETAEDDERQTA